MWILGLRKENTRHSNLQEAWREESDNGPCFDAFMAHQKKYKAKSTCLQLPACSTGPGSVTVSFKSCVAHKKVVSEACNVMANQSFQPLKVFISPNPMKDLMQKASDLLSVALKASAEALNW